MAKINFENRTVRVQLTSRGGGVEIHLDGLKNNKYRGHKMTAYQNYLGGGRLGSIQNDCTIEGWKRDNYLVKVAEELRRHYFDISAPDTTEAEYEELQVREASAY